MADPVKPYIQIKPDGTVLLFSSQLEMGQGAHTGVASIVAEELDADFDSIQVVNAANGTTANGDVYGNLVGGGFQITGGKRVRFAALAAIAETMAIPDGVQPKKTARRTKSSGARDGSASIPHPRFSARRSSPSTRACQAC